VAILRQTAILVVRHTAGRKGTNNTRCLITGCHRQRDAILSSQEIYGSSDLPGQALDLRPSLRPLRMGQGQEDVTVTLKSRSRTRSFKILCW